MNMPLSVLNRRRRIGAASAIAFSPSTLFALAEPGVWYDPSDLTTLFQDTAGTTPVVTPGQTVALMLDKSKGLTLGPDIIVNGDFATDTNWSKGAGWTISGGVATYTPGAGAFMTQTISSIAGKLFQMTLTVSQGQIAILGSQYIQNVVLGVGTHTILVTPSFNSIPLFSSTLTTLDNISVKELAGNHATQATAASRPTYGVVPLGGRRNILLATDTMATQTRAVTAAAHTLAFTGTGTVTLTGVSTAGPLVGTGVSDRVSLTFTPTAGNLTLTVSGSVTLAQLELGSTATAYQRVTTAFDVTEAGVQSLSYLSFDGVDDGMVTPTITPGIDRAQVFAGVRKLSDAAAAILIESSVSNSTNNGSFAFIAPPASGDASYTFASRGTARTPATSPTSYAAPITSVLTGIGDIAGDNTTLRVNGTQVAQATGDQGTGNYLAYPIYVGRRAGTSLPFSGNIFSLLVRFGANLDTTAITNTEAWVAGKTGVTL